jgi:hypothetical protein
VASYSSRSRSCTEAQGKKRKRMKYRSTGGGGVGGGGMEARRVGWWSLSFESTVMVGVGGWSMWVDGRSVDPQVIEPLLSILVFCLSNRPCCTHFHSFVCFFLVFCFIFWKKSCCFFLVFFLFLGV